MTAESNKSSSEGYGKNNEKEKKNTDTQGKPTSSTSTTVSAPDKTVPNTVHSENQPTDSATKVVANKTDSSITKRVHFQFGE